MLDIENIEFVNTEDLQAGDIARLVFPSPQFVLVCEDPEGNKIAVFPEDSFTFSALRAIGGQAIRVRDARIKVDATAVDLFNNVENVFGNLCLRGGATPTYVVIGKPHSRHGHAVLTFRKASASGLVDTALAFQSWECVAGTSQREMLLFKREAPAAVPFIA